MSGVLKLDHPICAIGDEFLDAKSLFNEIQIFPEYSVKDTETLSRSRDLRKFVGRRVEVEGHAAFGAHTMHHHALLLLPIARIAIWSDPTESYGTAMTTVQGFYLALGAGNGEEASKFVIPAKRSSGPLSAAAISKFYGNLSEPLTCSRRAFVVPGVVDAKMPIAALSEIGRARPRAEWRRTAVAAARCRGFRALAGRHSRAPR